jgi:hypothetical protein
MTMEVVLLRMASPRTYECLVCKRNGIDDVLVYLNGKDTEGRTRYLNEDMSTHTHQGTSTSTQQLMTTKQPSNEQIVPLLRIINTKLDRLLTETVIKEHVEGRL